MSPGADLTKELKAVGLPSLVKSFGIAAEPLADLVETVNEILAPVFEPMMDEITDAVENELPNLNTVVTDSTQTFKDIGHWLLN
jgi:hypothetical protein